MPKKEEKKYNIYDPSVGAYREVSKEMAQKFVESATEVEKQLSEDNE